MIQSRIENLDSLYKVFLAGNWPQYSAMAVLRLATNLMRQKSTYMARKKGDRQPLMPSVLMKSRSPWKPAIPPAGDICWRV